MLKNTNIVLGGLLFLFSMMLHADPAVSLSQSVIQSKIGSIVSVDLMMSDFTSTEGGGVNIKYNPKMIRVNRVVIDSDTWDFVNRDGVINNTEGTVSDILFSNYRGISGDVKIATIEIEVIGKGNRRNKIVLSESDSNPFAGNGEAIAVTFESTRVRVRR